MANLEMCLNEQVYKQRGSNFPIEFTSRFLCYLIRKLDKDLIVFFFSNPLIYYLLRTSSNYCNTISEHGHMPHYVGLMVADLF